MIYFSQIYWDFLHDLVCSVKEKESQALEKNVDSTAEWDGPVSSIYWHQIYSVIVFLSLVILLSERSAYHQRKWITIDLMDNSPFRSMDACFAYFSVLCWVWAFMTVIANWLLWNAISSDHVGKSILALPWFSFTQTLFTSSPPAGGASSWSKLPAHEVWWDCSVTGLTCVCLTNVPISHSVFWVMGDFTPATRSVLMEKGSHCLYGSHCLLGLWIFCLHSLTC